MFTVKNVHYPHELCNPVYVFLVKELQIDVVTLLKSIVKCTSLGQCVGRKMCSYCLCYYWFKF